MFCLPCPRELGKQPKIPVGSNLLNNTVAKFHPECAQGLK